MTATATAVTVEQAKKYLKANCPVELQAKVKEYYSLGSEADRSNCFNEIAKIMPLTCDVNKAFIFFNVANGVESYDAGLVTTLQENFDYSHAQIFA
jgi:hypothetical protein